MITTHLTTLYLMSKILLYVNYFQNNIIQYFSLNMFNRVLNTDLPALKTTLNRTENNKNSMMQQMEKKSTAQEPNWQKLLSKYP